LGPSRPEKNHGDEEGISAPHVHVQRAARVPRLQADVQRRPELEPRLGRVPALLPDQLTGASVAKLKRCPSGKIAHQSQIAAQKALFAAYSQHRAGRDESRTYRCPDCGKWHLTSSRGLKRPA
jgi:hypothetical protein